MLLAGFQRTRLGDAVPAPHQGGPLLTCVIIRAPIPPGREHPHHPRQKHAARYAVTTIRVIPTVFGASQWQSPRAQCSAHLGRCLSTHLGSSARTSRSRSLRQKWANHSRRKCENQRVIPVPISTKSGSKQTPKPDMAVQHQIAAEHAQYPLDIGTKRKISTLGAAGVVRQASNAIPVRQPPSRSAGARSAPAAVSIQRHGRPSPPTQAP